jgi:YesN/AraC family two-component response regulator
MHCKKVVKEELKKLGLHFVIVDMGVVDVMENISAEQHEQIKIALFKSGLELMDNKKAMLIEEIKNVIIEMVRYMDELSQTNFSDYLSEKLNYDYTYLAGLFSEGRGTTIENFINYQKIERVKELIIYDEFSLKEIARKMHYDSVSHLSSQFKKITGLTLSYFNKLNSKRRILVEDVQDL